MSRTYRYRRVWYGLPSYNGNFKYVWDGLCPHTPSKWIIEKKKERRRRRYFEKYQLRRLKEFVPYPITIWY